MRDSTKDSIGLQGANGAIDVIEEIYDVAKAKIAYDITADKENIAHLTTTTRRHKVMLEKVNER